MLKKILLLLTAIIMVFTMSVCAVDSYGGYNIPVDISINGSNIKCVEKPVLINNTTYVPLRAFSDAVGGSVGWNGAAKCATMEKSGQRFEFYAGTNRCFVNGKEKNYSSVIYRNLTFIPLRAISEVLGYDVQWDDFNLAVKITASGVNVPESCKDYSYQNEDVLYLGKIVQIESGNQPFEVKLAVAGAVMNRVRSPKFPSTVKGVILDTKYGVQFPPAHTDKINVTPSKESIIAAKCALNGINTVGNSLYFIDAKSAPNSWAHKNRPHYKTISGMSFYE